MPEISLIQIVEFAFMLVIDLCFLVALVLLMLPLGIWRQAAFAVMKRNFVGYFSNPTGYVFLCLFVLLTSFAAFWPHEFFTTNLANFDQLNKYLPYIMLIFIPAITMSIWAEERRQGTDELLLTLPAKDFDIVIGKYFAAVLVFTVSLLFSQLSNFGVLLAMTGGDNPPDNLLLFSTYLGYWFVGIAMISLGMVASFLTNNLTVGFIFGAAFNAPLAFFSNSDVILSNSTWIQRLFDWSLLQRFEPFGRGLISASSICYFLGIVVIGVYLSLILIGRRHWLGGRDGTSMFWHFVLRALFLFVIAVGAVLIVQHSPLNRFRMDISDKKISTLAESTTAILEELGENEDGKPIEIEAYVGSSVPTEYVKTKYDLVNLLREFDVMGGSRVKVNVHQGVEPFSEDAILAEKRFGIRPQKVLTQSRGAPREEDVILGVAVSSGQRRIINRFLSYGMPVEYELMRAIKTVSREQRKVVGIVQTDALVTAATVRINGRVARIPKLKIIQDLEKQCDVEIVDASNEISLYTEVSDGEEPTRRYDVLLVVQPSKMTPSEMENLTTALKAGQPALIFEDPLPSQQGFPNRFSTIGGTFFPRRLQRNGNQAAKIEDLWDLLDLDIDRRQETIQGNKGTFPWLVWHSADVNLYKLDSRLNQPGEVFVIRETEGRGSRFSADHPAMQGIEELFFQYAGYLKQKPTSRLNFEDLVKTGSAGRIFFLDWLVHNQMQPNPNELRKARGASGETFVLAAHIKGDNWETMTKSGEGSKDNLNVVYVADMDLLSDYFVDMRNAPIRNKVEYISQNMSFVLNLLDSLAGENTFLDIRNRRVSHVTLAKIDENYQEAQAEVFKEENEIQVEYTTELSGIQQDLTNKMKPLQEQIQKMEAKKKDNKPYDSAKLAAKKALLDTEVREQRQRLQTRTQELNIEREEKKRRINLDAELKIQKIQQFFKLCAVVIPPIPPLIVGIIVFFRRRLREREGISKARRLK
jgi:ABC-2 type transport system permease protein